VTLDAETRQLLLVAFATGTAAFAARIAVATPDFTVFVVAPLARVVFIEPIGIVAVASINVFVFDSGVLHDVVILFDDVSVVLDGTSTLDQFADSQEAVAIGVIAEQALGPAPPKNSFGFFIADITSTIGIDLGKSRRLLGADGTREHHNRSRTHCTIELILHRFFLLPLDIITKTSNGKCHLIDFLGQ
jgi:hypothetical protein